MTKMPKTQPQKIEDWEKEFDEKFINCKDDWGINVVGYGITKRTIKFFIRHLLKSEKEKLLKKLEIEYDEATASWWILTERGDMMLPEKTQKRLETLKKK